MPNWTEPTAPVYTTATDTADGTVRIAVLHDEVLASAFAQKAALQSITAPPGLATFVLLFGEAIAAGNQAALDAIVLAHRDRGDFSGKHFEDKYDTDNRLLSRVVYAFKDPVTLALSGKVEETVYTYKSGTPFLLTSTFKRFDFAGAAIETKTFEHTSEKVGPVTLVRARLV